MTHVPEPAEPVTPETLPSLVPVQKLAALPLLPRKIIYVAGGFTILAEVLYRYLRWITTILVSIIILVVVSVALAPFFRSATRSSAQGGFELANGGVPNAPSVRATDTVLPSVTLEPTSTPELLIVTTGSSRVRTQDVNLRSRPGPEEKPMKILLRGTSVEVLGEAQRVDDSVWIRVRAQGVEGWVNQRYIFRVEDYISDTRPRARVIGVKPDNLIIRSLPSKDGSVQGRLSEGAEVTIMESREVDGITWWFIKIDDLQGWANGAYLEGLP